MWVWLSLSVMGIVGILFALIALSALLQPSTGYGGSWFALNRGQRSANRRAEAMLSEFLSEEQHQQLQTCGYLDVPSPSLEHRFYRIPGQGGLVSVYERGCILMGLCLQPTQPLPPADVVIMHKLLIEANEREYLHTANHLAPQVLRRQR